MIDNPSRDPDRVAAMALRAGRLPKTDAEWLDIFGGHIGDYEAGEKTAEDAADAMYWIAHMSMSWLLHHYLPRLSKENVKLRERLGDL